MSKLYPTFLGAVCLFWIAGWTWWLSNEVNQKAGTNGPPVSAFTISHDGFKFASEDIFYFNHSESVPSIPPDNQQVFQSLASHLAKNKGEVLSLTGTYTLDETNRSPFPNLGVARAEALKTILVEKGAPPENISTRALPSNSFFQTKGKLKGGVYFSFSEKEKPETPEDAPKAPTTESVNFQQVIFYETGKYKLEKKYLPALTEWRNRLRSQKDEVVIITGFSESGEEDTSKFKLAEMRAKGVRRYLIDHGVRRNQIEVIAKPGMAKKADERVVTLTLK